MQKQPQNEQTRELEATTPSLYVIELYGGRYDGCRLPCEIVPLSMTIELPGRELCVHGATARWMEVYEHRRTTVAFHDEKPTISLHFHHTGSRIDAPQLPRKWPVPLQAILDALFS